MKLNNKGWGTTEMLLLSGGLLIALLVAVFFISKLYGSFENSVANRQYVDLENKLEDAAKEYVRKENISVENELRISATTLKDKNYLNSLSDNEGNSCSGYVNVFNSNGTKYYSAFISCPKYETANY